MEETWKNLTKGVQECETNREVKIKKKRLGKHSCWTEYKKKKRNVYKVYRKWKKGRQGKEEYLRLRREFREKCKEQEEKNRKRSEEEIKNITTEAQVWIEICELR